MIVAKSIDAILSCRKILAMVSCLVTKFKCTRLESLFKLSQNFKIACECSLKLKSLCDCCKVYRGYFELSQNFGYG